MNIAFVLFVVASIALWLWGTVRMWRRQPRAVERWSDESASEVTADVRTNGGWVWQVRGSATVWRFFPSGVRCGISWELFLSDAWTGYRWQKEGRAP